MFEPDLKKTVDHLSIINDNVISERECTLECTIRDTFM